MKLSLLLSTVLLTIALSTSFGVVQDDSNDDTSGQTITLTQEELRTLVESAVVQKIRPLQREIAELKETTRLHDILGGIGYIMGIGGVVFYFLGVRRKESHT